MTSSDHVMVCMVGFLIGGRLGCRLVHGGARMMLVALELLVGLVCGRQVGLGNRFKVHPISFYLIV